MQRVIRAREMTSCILYATGIVGGTCSMLAWINRDYCRDNIRRINETATDIKDKIRRSSPIYTSNSDQRQFIAKEMSDIETWRTIELDRQLQWMSRPIYMYTWPPPPRVQHENL